MLAGVLSSLKNNFASLTVPEKRTLIKLLVKKIVWDGENFHIFIDGEQELVSDLLVDSLKGRKVRFKIAVWLVAHLHHLTKGNKITCRLYQLFYHPLYNCKLNK